MTIEKVTNYVTLKVNQYIIQYNEVAEYREAIKENRKVFEPSKLELVRELIRLFYIIHIFELLSL